MSSVVMLLSILFSWGILFNQNDIFHELETSFLLVTIIVPEGSMQVIEEQKSITGLLSSLCYMLHK